MIFDIFKENEYRLNDPILLGQLEAKYIWEVDIRPLLAFYTDEKYAMFTEPYFPGDGTMRFGCLLIKKHK